MDSELEVIRTEMEATRGSLADKIGALESQVRDTVAEAGEAVSATKEGVMDVVASVADTVTSVKESVKETFNISKHVEEHPWAALGVAVAAGAMGGFLLRSPKSSPASTNGHPSYAPSAPSPSPLANGFSNGTPKEEPSLFDSIFSKIQGMAVASLMDIAKDMVQQSAPEPWKAGLEDKIHDVAAKLK